MDEERERELIAEREKEIALSHTLESIDERIEALWTAVKDLDDLVGKLRTDFDTHTGTIIHGGK